MLKAIALLSFLAVVIVLLALKHAGRGARAAFRYVDEVSAPHAVTRTAVAAPAMTGDQDLVAWVSGALEIQKHLLSTPSGMPPKALDTFSLGYVSGFCDAALQRRGIPTGGRAYAIMTAVLMDLFGTRAGSQQAERFLNIQEDPDFIRGSMVGGRELMDWLRKEGGAVPLGWSDHVRAS